MSEKRKITHNVKGWFELYFRAQDAPKPASIKDIKQADYKHHCGRIAAHEFDKVMDVVEIYMKKQPSAPRGLRELDVVTFFKWEPTKASASYLVVHQRNLRQFGYPGCQYFCENFTDLVLVPLRDKDRFEPLT